jgi:hypothetical protein
MHACPVCLDRNDALAAQVHQLEVAPRQLCLRLPVTVRHVIDAGSPLAHWRQGPAGIGADASSEIVVVVRCTEQAPLAWLHAGACMKPGAGLVCLRPVYRGGSIPLGHIPLGHD